MKQKEAHGNKVQISSSAGGKNGKEGGNKTEAGKKGKDYKESAALKSNICL